MGQDDVGCATCPHDQSSACTHTARLPPSLHGRHEQISAQGRPEGPSLMAACRQVRSCPSASSSGSCLAPAARPSAGATGAGSARAPSSNHGDACGCGSLRSGFAEEEKGCSSEKEISIFHHPLLVFHARAGRCWCWAGSGLEAPQEEKEPGRAHGTCFGFVMGSMYGNGFHSNYLCQPGEEFYYRLLASLPALPPSEGSLIGQPFSGMVPSYPVP